ncbi:MAG: 2-hydroxyglutaryl-CoA dehydratase, partial [Myxococcales bacterium]|nr:2-hydroxyglutaryl-CoA dehydratase [Myxococcales bacterium]
GAEVDIQLVTAWLLYMLWEGRWDTRRRWDLKRDDGGKYGMEGIDPWKQIITLDSADKLIRVLFQTFAHIMGLNGYHLPDMDEIADLAHQHYDNAARGGEGHMEVGKLIQNVVNNKVTMTLSVKPFGCMPSSGVSDGVQALVTSLHPDAIFLPIETSGDSAVNVQSRVQMMLFKARRVAEKELEKALADTGLDLETARKLLAGDKRLRNPLFKAPHVGGSTAADMVHAAAARMRGNGMTRRLRTLAERTPGLNRLAARFA